jgi:hypothetical protein
VVADTSDLATAPAWGSHWVYHAFAEAVSIGFGTFVAAGLARERAQVAGLIGGFAISLWWTVPLVILMLPLGYSSSNLVSISRPEWVIAAITVIAAPIVGYNLGQVTQEISTEQPTGFAGIPRAHFLWLWVPVHFYAVAIIGPTMTYFGSQLVGADDNALTGSLYVARYVVPVIAFAVPLFIGFGLMSGQIGNSGYGSTPMRPVLRQSLGSIVVIVGWWIAAGIHYGLLQILNWL